MKLRLAAPSVLVDIGRIPDLRYIRLAGSEVVIGALTRDHDLETSALLRAEVPLLAHVALRSETRRSVPAGLSGGVSHMAMPPLTCQRRYWPWMAP